MRLSTGNINLFLQIFYEPPGYFLDFVDNLQSGEKYTLEFFQFLRSQLMSKVIDIPYEKILEAKTVLELLSSNDIKNVERVTEKNLTNLRELFWLFLKLTGVIGIFCNLAYGIELEYEVSEHLLKSDLIREICTAPKVEQDSSINTNNSVSRYTRILILNNIAVRVRGERFSERYLKETADMLEELERLKNE